jgi:Asp-tRNA(Asn)/Glu-tRNA(Gln) amidotransferase A subunit family amidase
MDRGDIMGRGNAELRAAILRREIMTVAAAEASLAALENWQPVTNALTRTRGEAALDTAGAVQVAARATFAGLWLHRQPASLRAADRRPRLR